jgi:hypothetical protein
MTDISLEHMEATATQILDNYYTAFPFRSVEDQILSQLIDARVAQMEITSDAMRGQRSMMIEDVEEQVRTMHRVLNVKLRHICQRYAGRVQLCI